MVRCGDETLLRRPLSVHQVDETKTKFALLFATVGKGTLWLSRRQTNEKVDVFGPLGNGFNIQPNSKNLLLVAGGIGITPLSFLAETAVNRGCTVKLHQGVNTDGEVLLEALRSPDVLVPYSGVPASIECTASTAIASANWPTGMATVCVPGLAAWADQIFACGPMPMYKAMAQMVELKGKPVQVSLEVVMGCGRGICYGCAIKTKQGLKEVCQDGPVLDLDDILWDKL